MKVSAPPLAWEVRRRLSVEAELDLARRFASGTPAYLLLMAAFAYGSFCWPAHPGPIAAFAGLFASAACWHRNIVTGMCKHYERCPAFWNASLRRAVYASAASWALFAAWSGLNHSDANQIFLLTLVTAGAAIGNNLALGSDEVLTERCLLILLTPMLCIQLANGAYALALLTAFSGVMLVAQARAQSVTYWNSIAERADLVVRAERAEQTLAMVVEAASPVRVEEPNITPEMTPNSVRALVSLGR